MRKFSVFAAAALVFAVLPLCAAAATRSANDQAPGPKVRTHWFAGSVTAVGSDSVSLSVLWTGPKDGQLNGKPVTVAVNSDTEIVNGKSHSPAQLSDIRTGDLLGLRTTATDSTLATLTATHIRIWCNCHWAGGTISALGSNSISVQVVRTGPYDTVLRGKSATFQTSDSTRYIRGRSKTQIGFSDLRVGDGVGLIFAADGFFRAPGFDPSTATFTAKQVHLWEKRQVPPPATDTGAAGTTP